MGYSKDYIAQEKASLLDWVASGQMIKAYCREEGTPCFRTVYYWLEADAEFADSMRQAKIVGYDALAQEALEIADDCEMDREAVQKAKLQVHTRLQLLARWDSGRYGDRLTLDGHLTGEGLSNEAAMRQIVALLTKARERQLARLDPDNRLTDSEALN